MKFQNVLDMLFELLEKRKVTATYFSKKYGVSVRTVYRYVDELRTALPITITRGRSGGISLPDCYKLPVGYMSNEEYGATLDALDMAYCATTDERYLIAREKLAAEYKPDEEDLKDDEDAANGIIAIEPDDRPVPDTAPDAQPVPSQHPDTQP